MTDALLQSSPGMAGKPRHAELEDLRRKVKGAFLLKGELGYDEARSIWNAMIDRSPACIIRCANAADVTQGLEFARRHGLPLAVKGGGHNIAGNAVCDDGVMLDLSQMTDIRVDVAAKRVSVEPGALLGMLDRATQEHGLVVPTGINSTTGVAGLTLGGGIGWLTRKYGLTIDSLVEAEVVTANGKTLRASNTENPDLFWAIRGGGGNYGIVTRFHFALHALVPEVLAGMVVHPLDDAPTLLRRYREAVASAPDELTCWVVLRKAPPLPFLPAEWHGKEILALAMCYAGDPAEGERATAPLRALGKPIADVVGRQNFADWQTAFDPLLAPGARNYWKSHDFDRLSDGLIDAIVAAVRVLPTPECEIFIGHLGGAMANVPPEATPYPNRAAHFLMNMHTRWRDPSDDTRCIAWARDLFRATEPFASGSVYVNFMPDDDSLRIEKAYGNNFRRLAELKRKFDPDNLFHLNQNIRPAG